VIELLCLRADCDILWTGHRNASCLCVRSMFQSPHLTVAIDLSVNIRLFCLHFSICTFSIYALGIFLGWLLFR